ncbi:MAG: transposase [Planctomycetota bacterium]|jgi:transposase
MVFGRLSRYFPFHRGPNLSGLIVLLSGEYRMSRRNIQRFIEDSHGIKISLGAISSLEHRISSGLRTAHAEAMTSVASSATKHLDETTWRQSSRLAWLWTAVGEDATVFVIRDSRASSVARELIGDEPNGIIISDRYSGYSYIDLDQRQVCLAHLLRDFRRMAEGEESLRWIGQRLLGLLNGRFRLWGLYRDDEIDRSKLKRWSRQLRMRMIRLLNEGAGSTGYETPGMCRGILRTEPAMWTFIETENVEPTNNIAERAIRPAVILRKTSLGTQSERGSRFVERMQTVSVTLKKTGRNLHDFIGEVTHAVLHGARLPKLLG